MRFHRRFVAACAALTVCVGGVLAQAEAADAAVDTISAAAAGTAAAPLIAETVTTDTGAARVSSSFPVSGVLVDPAANPIADADVQADLYAGPALLDRTTPCPRSRPPRRSSPSSSSARRLRRKARC